MNFKIFDHKMRVFETSSDHCVPQGSYMVARLDGRGFTKLTNRMDKPFSTVFNIRMCDTVKHLMGCGFNILYAYTQSDEISLLFHPSENSFNRKTRKFISILAGEASAVFTLSFGHPAVFDCRISALPDVGTAVDYFRWRQSDCLRNALNSMCYHALRNDGQSSRQATKTLKGVPVKEKKQLYTDITGDCFREEKSWKRLGIGFSWKKVKSTGYNPISEQHVDTYSNRIIEDPFLPEGEEYSEYIAKLLEGEDK